MKAWTVSSTDNPAHEPLDHCVAGTYTSRERALDECVKYIMERLRVRDDLARSMAHDENHREAAAFFVRKRNGYVAVRKGCVGKLRAYLAAELARRPHYYVSDGGSEWHFDVDEAAVEGELWTVVTWGSSDTEDPNFTTPWPATFRTREAAIQSFVDYARRVFLEYDKVFKDVEATIRRAIAEFNGAHLDLDDGCSIACVLYRDEMKGIEE